MSALTTLENEEKLLELEVKKFELEQRRSTALSKSAFFPDTLKGDVASAVIVYDLAQRMNISVMEVAQSIYIIYGRPSFSTSFLVARLNQSGLIQGSLKSVISADKQSCYCAAVDSTTGETNIGMTVTMDIAKKEGWVSKKGSKWQTMPELMLRKRSQSFFIKEFYPQVMFGLQSQEEIIDAEIVPKETISLNEKNNVTKSLNKQVAEPSQPIQEVQPIEVEITPIQITPSQQMKNLLVEKGVNEQKAEDWCMNNAETLQLHLDEPTLVETVAEQLVDF